MGYNQKHRFYRNMDDSEYGIRFGKFIMVKMRLSDKDLLLLFGILIAVVIAITTLAFNEDGALKKEASQKELQPKTSLAPPTATGLIKKAIEKIDLDDLLIR